MKSYIEEYLTNCVLYILGKKETGWSIEHEYFYNEFDFICHARHQGSSISNQTQTDSLQTTLFLHREELK